MALGDLYVRLKNVQKVSREGSLIGISFLLMFLESIYTCFLRNLYAGQETTVRTGHGTTNWFQIGKGVRQGCIDCHPAYLTYMQSASREMLGWMKHKLESRLLRETSITSDMQMTPP